MHFYPRPPRGGRRAGIPPSMRVSEISIHALRGEGDPLPERLPRHWRSISIHALRGEGDSETLKQRKQSFAFLSTPSAGRATWRKGYIQCTNGISIHALRGEGDKAERPSFQIREISIHALRGEGDQENTISRNTLDQFLSTPSAGRATHCKGMAADIVVISIHALRGEGDQRSNQAHDADLGISIHALRGEGDARRDLSRIARQISIHALRGEGDQRAVEDMRKAGLFLSTPSAGRATQMKLRGRRQQHIFLSTPSAGRATVLYPEFITTGESFLSTPSAGRATSCYKPFIRLYNPFLSTPSAGRATSLKPGLGDHYYISIHALRGEGDWN